jgi:hypothetical protein
LQIDRRFFSFSQIDVGVYVLSVFGVDRKVCINIRSFLIVVDYYHLEKPCFGSFTGGVFQM